VIASGGEQLALVVYLACWPASGDPVALAVPVHCDREQLIAAREAADHAALDRPGAANRTSATAKIDA
jgi:hypothetical protein